MDTATAPLPEASIPYETGPAPSASVPSTEASAATISSQVAREIERAKGITEPTQWQFDHKSNAFVHPVTKEIVTREALTAWEKLQRTPDGKDALRGIRLMERLTRFLAHRSQTTNREA